MKGSARARRSLVRAPDAWAHLPRHKASDLNRHAGEVLDEAAQRGGVIVSATAERPEMILAPRSEWRRLSDLAVLARLLADILSDLNDLIAGRQPVAPRVPWVGALDPADLRGFASELAATARLSMETSDPEPLRQALYAWKSTAEFRLAGDHRALQHPNWDRVIELVRPGNKED